ncbi:hypothetical protein HUE87_11805 [Candidatus Sulfurimonas marisnigri]|uniref:Uncharacterized protein n=1 Tax=Candidatus Sulfurimonas marisnigri TaxID=2740405 RepID=A0A7S7LZV9_9BACT|nr:hypothetical protein [Candidatus Sulfurimonas marisnigri]QOY54533.1 hypothetical protein HUE87_11805 [Candidatus Sulfurimonas marisnigri]
MIDFNKNNLIEEDDSIDDTYDYTNEEPLDNDDEDQEEDNDDRYCD